MITKCNTYTNNKFISVSENRRNFKIKNSSTFYINKVIVDDCYIKVGERCDYLFEIINNDTIENVFYVELKGSNITHAVEQLKATIAHCKNIHSAVALKQCYIVASKFPSAGPSSQTLKKKFKRENKIQLFIDTKIKEIAI